MARKSNNKKQCFVYVRLNEDERRQLEAVAKRYRFKTISSLIVSVSVYRFSLLCNKSRRVVSSISRTESLIKNLYKVRFENKADEQKLLKNIYSKNKLLKKLLLKSSEGFNNHQFKKRVETEQQREIILKIALTENEKMLLDKNQIKYGFNTRSGLLRYSLCYFDNDNFQKQQNIIDTIKSGCDRIAEIFHKNFTDIYFLQEINKDCNLAFKALSGAQNDNKKQYKKPQE